MFWLGKPSTDAPLIKISKREKLCISYVKILMV